MPSIEVPAQFIQTCAIYPSTNNSMPVDVAAVIRREELDCLCHFVRRAHRPQGIAV